MVDRREGYQAHRSRPKHRSRKRKIRDLPMSWELTERDFTRLEAAATRQLERNKKRLARDGRPNG